MMSVKSRLPLPRYTERVWLKREQRWAYLFHVPTWAARPKDDDDRGRCPVKSEMLGADYAAAKQRVEEILLPQFDAWRTKGVSGFDAPSVVPGSFDWMVSVYRQAPQYLELAERQKRNFEYGLGLASRHLLRKNPEGLERFGQLRLGSITPGAADKLYYELKADRAPIIDPGGRPKLGRDGKPLQHETPRLRRAAEMIKACRRAWDVAWRQEPDKIPPVNPFAGIKKETGSKKTTTASFAQLIAFVKACDEAGEWSIGTAAMVAFFWLQRQEHILGVPRKDNRITGLLWAEYKNRDRPNVVLVRHPKTDEVVALPLYAKDGRSLFPELMQRLDRAPRRGALICLRDMPDKTGVYRPWPTKTVNNPLASFIHRVAALRDSAGLSKDITFRSFRSGGFTFSREADLSDSDIKAVGAKTDATLDLYAQSTLEQRQRALTRLLEYRTKSEQMSN